ncbi:Lectin [Stylosanthes scabra]|uniref:Lectin n=1 Tax=Stylosanthes scabra TaxID=79078 RepID=A0ABU6UFB4_9FABA|nr:Lectin [Stylosanthes scabra]
MASKITEYVSFYLGKPSSPQPNIILQGDATTSEGKLELTKVDEHGVPVRSSLGRALHINPVHIWDSETSNVASFFTCFSFTIQARDVKKTADGLAFFLAPVDDQPKSVGGYLGLFNGVKKGRLWRSNSTLSLTRQMILMIQTICTLGSIL